MGLLRAVAPEQVTLVPDAPDAFTSEEGWRLDADQAASAAASSALELGFAAMVAAYSQAGSPR